MMREARAVGRTSSKRSFSAETAICSASLELVFFDTTSLYFEGNGGESLGQYGHSKDHRPDLKQMMVGVCSTGPGARSAASCGRETSPTSHLSSRWCSD